MGAFVIVVGLGVRPLLYTLMRALMESHQQSCILLMRSAFSFA